jgi:hypothetical protein
VTKGVAEEILDEAAGQIMAALAHYRSVVAEANSDLRALEKAWKEWDVESLVILDVITEGQADEVERALERLDRG